MKYGVTHLKTIKKCKFCNIDMPIGTLVRFELTYYPYKHFKIGHIDCTLKNLEQRYKENVEAKAPEIILKEFKEIIDYLKEVVKK